METYCESAGCIKCKGVILMDPDDAEHWLTTHEMGAKLANFMDRLCTDGELKSPKQIRDEVVVKYLGQTMKTIALKAGQLRAYGWVKSGIFYVSFFHVKKQDEMTQANKRRLTKEVKYFIDANN